MVEEFNINKALKAISARVTDTQREEQNKLNIAGRTRLKQNAIQNQIARAAAQELAVRDSIRMLESEPDSEIKTLRLRNLIERLAELYSQQGLYEDAAATTLDDARREVYQRSADAIAKPDNEVCNCPPEIVTDRAKQRHIRVDSTQKVETLVRNGKPVSLRVCRTCGDVNAY